MAGFKTSLKLPGFDWMSLIKLGIDIPFGRLYNSLPRS